MQRYFESILPSHFGTLKIFWKYIKQEPKVCRILLPLEHSLKENLVCEYSDEVTLASCSVIADLREQIQYFLKGNVIEFDLGILDFEQCSEFQKKVLLTEYGIPRGWVSTYGRIAKYLGVPGGARAVGNALATNPFPIVIPCHRAIRSNGELGGYRGGIEMKRKLLEMEGIEFSTSGKVVTDRIYY